MYTSHPVESIFCFGVVDWNSLSLLVWVSRGFRPYAATKGVCISMGGGCCVIVGELSQWEASYPAILPIVSVDPEELLEVWMARSLSPSMYG